MLQNQRINLLLQFSGETVDEHRYRRRAGHWLSGRIGVGREAGLQARLVARTATETAEAAEAIRAKVNRHLRSR